MSKYLKFFTGRVGQWKRLKAVFGSTPTPLQPFWMHCASLGEFEQGRPLLSAIREKYPDKKILLTFFSPSGYEIRKNTRLADYVFYLPLDTPRNARRFLDLVKPRTAIFVKYEFWYFYLTGLKKRNVPTYLVSAHFRADQIFFKKYGALFRRMLTCFTHIFVQDESSRQLLESLPAAAPAAATPATATPAEANALPATLPVTVAGDTRFDRVVAGVTQDTAPETLIQLLRDPVLIAGSTWPKDHVFLKRLAEDMPLLQLVLVPHETDPAQLRAIRRLFRSPLPVFYSEALQEKNPAPPRILVIDSVGLLSRLYRHATLCYVGGGFNASGIHNILEPAVHAKPVLFGPNHSKFKEAGSMISQQAAVSFHNYDTLLSAVKHWMDNPALREQAGKTAGNYVLENTGATQLILQKMADRVP